MIISNTFSGLKNDVSTFFCGARQCVSSIKICGGWQQERSLTISEQAAALRIITRLGIILTSCVALKATISLVFSSATLYLVTALTILGICCELTAIANNYAQHEIDAKHLYKSFCKWKEIQFKAVGHKKIVLQLVSTYTSRDNAWSVEKIVDLHIQDKCRVNPQQISERYRQNMISDVQHYADIENLFKGIYVIPLALAY